MEEFVTFEIAKKLKEKGFKEKCIAYYWEKINEHTPSFVVEDNMPEDGVCILDLISEHNKAEWSHFIDAPIISQVLKWLREEKKYYISIGYNGDYSYEIVGIEDGEFVAAEDDYNTHEEAALAGIEYLLDNVI